MYPTSNNFQQEPPKEAYESHSYYDSPKRQEQYTLSSKAIAAAGIGFAGGLFLLCLGRLMYVLFTYASHVL